MKLSLNKFAIFLLSLPTLAWSTELDSFDWSIDRIYLTFGSQHYGWPESTFGIDGPEEFNPGLGLGWINRNNIDYSVAFYLDSYHDPSITAGLAYGLYRDQDTTISIGASYTQSLAGEKEIWLDEDTLGITQIRHFIAPHISVESHNAFLLFRFGTTWELKPVAILGFGFYFDPPK